MSEAVVDVRNLTGSAVTLESCGLFVPAAATVPLKPSTMPNWPVRDDFELRARITDDSVLLVLDGTELSKLRSLNFCSHPLAPVEDVEYFPQPEQGWDNNGAITASATLAGGSFILPRAVELNRIILRTTAFVAPATGVLFIYQEPRGRVVDSLPLVASVSFTPVASTTFQLAPSEGSVILSAGFFYALWGQDTGAGSFTLNVYNTNSVSTINTSAETGTHPALATSALDPAAPPATIDPFIGGDLVGAASDECPIIRFLNV